MKPQLLTGALNSGSGKTTFTMGLLRALSRRGLRVQPFKCGPDYIDTKFHGVATGRDSVNLDTWLASEDHVREVYSRYGEDADACVVEGVMGLFDGYDRMKGSSAEIAMLLGIPVLLVVNARSSAYTVAAQLHGVATFRPGLRLAGVVSTRWVPLNTSGCCAMPVKTRACAASDASRGRRGLKSLHGTWALPSLPKTG